MKNENVSNVEKNSLATNTVPLNTVHVNALEKLRCKRETINLQVEGDHEYFANGILTHNCDVVRYIAQGVENQSSGEVKRVKSPFGSSGKKYNI